MAQFLKVISSSEQKSEEANPFYANIDGSQTVQYVITDDQQQFSAQQVLLF